MNKNYKGLFIAASVFVFLAFTFAFAGLGCSLRKTDARVSQPDLSLEPKTTAKLPVQKPENCDCSADIDEHKIKEISDNLIGSKDSTVEFPIPPSEQEKILAMGNSDSLEGRISSNRTIAKNSEIDKLIDYYGKEVKVPTLITPKDNKNTIILNISATCPDCKKYLKLIEEQEKENGTITKILKDSNIYFVIRNSEEFGDDNLTKIRKAGMDYALVNKEVSKKLSNRVPATLILNKDGKLVDIGGIVHPDRILQLLKDLPQNPKPLK